MIQSDTAVLGRSMIFMNNSLFNKMNLSELWMKMNPYIELK